MVRRAWVQRPIGDGGTGRFVPKATKRGLSNLVFRGRRLSQKKKFRGITEESVNKLQNNTCVGCAQQNIKVPSQRVPPPFSSIGTISEKFSIN